MNKLLRKTVYVVLCIFSVYVASCLVFAGSSLAYTEPIERSEDELLIFETYVNDHKRSLGMLAYLPEGADISQTLLPISSVARSLSFSIKADLGNARIDGWFFNENNVLQVDLSREVVVLNGSERSLKPGSVELHYDDIYVQAEVLEEWLGIKFRPDISTLRLYVTSEEILPFEAEELRKKRAEAYEGRKVNSAEHEGKILPYQSFSPPSVIWQNTIQGSSVDGERSAVGDFSVQSRFDLMKFGTRFVLSGSKATDSSARINSSKLTFERLDPSSNMLGFMKAGAISLGDITYPDVPLALGRKRGRGVSVSSDSKFGSYRSSNAETYAVDGDAPIGWDAELYRNGYFVAFQEVSAEGRYNFEDVELVRGFNLMQVILYGPEGQKQTVTQRIIRGNDILREGQVNYEFAVGQPEADFLPIAEDARASSDFGGSGHISYGVKDYLTLGANVYTGEDNGSIYDDRQTSFGASAVVAVGPVKTSVQVMQANEGRSGYSAEVTTQVAKTNITASHEVYNGYHEDDKDLTKSSALSVSRNFKRASVSLNAEKNSYQKKDDETVVSANISTRLGPVQFSNKVERILSDNKAQEEFNGELSAVTGIEDWRLRANLKYDLEQGVSDKLQIASLSAYRKIGDDLTLRVNGDYTFTTDQLSADARVTKDFDTYSLDFNLGATNQNSYYGGLTFRTGFMADHKRNYQMVSARDGGLGAAGLRAFIDENGNGAYEDGEKLIKGISFRSNRGLFDGTTDVDGTLFVNGLPEGLTVLQVDPSTLPSIYLKPQNDTVEIIPRNGSMTTIDFAFDQLGEIDGFITENKTDKPVVGALVLLFDTQTGEEVASINSEYDGYYIFSSLPMGAYRIEVVPVWGDADNISMDVVLDYDQPVQANMDMQIPAVRATVDTTTQSNTGASEETIIPSATTSSGYYVHLGSMSSVESAEGEQQRLWAHYDVLSDIIPGIYNVSVNGKDFYRVLGVVSTREEGQSICDAIKAANEAGGCAVIKM